MLRRLVLIALLASAVPRHARADAVGGDLSPGVRALLAAGNESSELRELRQAEEAMFHYGLSSSGSSGLPSGTTSEVTTPPVTARGGADLSYLQGIALPAIPMRWDDVVVQYLEYFREDPRGHDLMTAWLRRSTRYAGVISEALEDEGLPPDLKCVALAESGFDPRARSNAGAVGMWQFVSVTGDEYGLTQNRWVDERMDPYRSTRAAAKYLGDLHRRLGTWELALAAYNMGYGALLRSIRKYNSNDYGVLSRVEAGLPFETTVYVGKILACSVVMRNPERFGFGDVARDAPIATASVDVPGGTSLGAIAGAAGVPVADLAALNPHLLRGRTPPGATYGVRVPRASTEAFARAWARRRPDSTDVSSYVLRFGERLDDVAERHRTTSQSLRQLNEIGEDERVGAGTALLVPNVRARAETRATERPVVAVPATRFSYADRRRVFYRTASGDSLTEIATFFRVDLADVLRWNQLDSRASLAPGLLLQLFVPRAFDASTAIVLSESDVRVLVVGSEEFFDYHETQRGRVRVRYRVEHGDTLGTIAHRFGIELADLSRINRMGRNARLAIGQEIIVYTSRDVATRLESSQAPASPERDATPAPSAPAATPAPVTSDDTETAPSVGVGGDR